MRWARCPVRFRVAAAGATWACIGREGRRVGPRKAVLPAPPGDSVAHSRDRATVQHDEHDRSPLRLAGAVVQVGHREARRSEVICPACQAENVPQNKFCGECGARLPVCLRRVRARQSRRVRSSAASVALRLRRPRRRRPSGRRGSRPPRPAAPAQAPPGKRRPSHPGGRRAVASGQPVARLPRGRARQLYAQAPRREDPHVEERGRGRAQDGDRDVLGRVRASPPCPSASTRRRFTGSWTGRSG